MTDANLTEIVCVLDRSGSMHSIIDDAIGGINRLIAEQQALDCGECRMTTVLFDNDFTMVHENTPIKDVQPFTRQTYVPRASTALFDAIGRTIDDVGKRFAGLPESKRPGKVLFVILTDGHENSSTCYTRERIGEMVARQQNEWQWKFIYLSAELDAFAQGAGLNIGTRVSYRGTGQSIGATYCVASSAAASYRKTGNLGEIHDSCVNVTDTGDVSIDSSDGVTGSGAE